MAVELTPFGKFCKWCVVPVALAALGYYYLGPRVSRSTNPKLAKVQSIAEQIRAAKGTAGAANEPKGEPEPSANAASEAQQKFNRVRQGEGAGSATNTPSSNGPETEIRRVEPRSPNTRNSNSRRRGSSKAEPTMSIDQIGNE